VLDRAAGEGHLIRGRGPARVWPRRQVVSTDGLGGWGQEGVHPDIVAELSGVIEQEDSPAAGRSGSPSRGPGALGESGFGSPEGSTSSESSKGISSEPQAPRRRRETSSPGHGVEARDRIGRSRVADLGAGAASRWPFQPMTQTFSVSTLSLR